MIYTLHAAIHPKIRGQFCVRRALSTLTFNLAWLQRVVWRLLFLLGQLCRPLARSQYPVLVRLIRWGGDPWLSFPEEWVLPACLHMLPGIQGEIRKGPLAWKSQQWLMAHFGGKTSRKISVAHPLLPEMLLDWILGSSISIRAGIWVCSCLGLAESSLSFWG